MLRAFTSSLHRAARATGPHRALSACRPASTTSTVVQVPAGEYAIGSWKESRLESELGGLFKTHGFVSGHWRSGSGNTFAVHDPATGDLIAECSDLTGEDASEAVHVAAEAMPAWSSMTVVARAAILNKVAELLRTNADALATIMSAESGKPRAESLGEVAYSLSYFEYYAAAAQTGAGQGSVLPPSVEGKLQMTTRAPVGVCAFVTPWNFPLAMLARKVAAALAAGCTVVAKPGEDTPFSALALAEICQRAGVPDGCVNVVPCGRERAQEVGLVLTTHPTVKKFSFTGSTMVGKTLAAQCASTAKKVSMELGGNAPFIVFADADVEAAAAAAVACKFRNCGQTCVSANRIFVASEVYDEFAQAFARQTSAALTVGHGLEEGTSIGPLINSKGRDKAAEQVADAISKGAEVLLGGGNLETTAGSGKGSFFAPTILAGATRDMAAFSEETFGPVAPLFRFDDEDEVVAFANDVPVGLAAYVFSRDIARCFRVADALEFGMVGINEGIISSAHAPFGGIKESGYGREGGAEGLQDYLCTKYLCISRS